MHLRTPCFPKLPGGNCFPVGGVPGKGCFPTPSTKPDRALSSNRFKLWGTRLPSSLGWGNTDGKRRK